MKNLENTIPNTSGPADSASPNSSPDNSRTDYSKYLRHWIRIAWSLAVALIVWVAFSIWSSFVSVADKHYTQSAGNVSVNVTVRPTIVKELDVNGQVVSIGVEEPSAEASKIWANALQPALNKAVEEATKEQMEVIGARVDDTWSAVQGIGLISGVIGVLITIMVLYFSFQNSESIQNTREELSTLANYELDKQLKDQLPFALKGPLEDELSNGKALEQALSNGSALKTVLSNGKFITDQMAMYFRDDVKGQELVNTGLVAALKLGIDKIVPAKNILDAISQNAIQQFNTMVCNAPCRGGPLLDDGDSNTYDAASGLDKPAKKSPKTVYYLLYAIQKAEEKFTGNQDVLSLLGSIRSKIDSLDETKAEKINDAISKIVDSPSHEDASVASLDELKKICKEFFGGE